MSQPSVLVLSASGGSGHLRAGEALRKAAQALPQPPACEHYDCLNFTSRLFKQLYGGTYIEMVNRAPELWGYLYSLAENQSLRKRLLFKVFDHFNYQRYLRTLRSLKPDAIVCTHFLPYRSISETLRKAGIAAPIFAATTDFDVHNYWIDPIVHRYYVYHEESAWQLSAKGVNPDKIRVLGIPIAPEFETKLPKEAARRELGIASERFTLLVMAGGFGVGSMEDLVAHTSAVLGSQSGLPSTVLVVCGNNQSARGRLERSSFPAHLDVRVFGFVDNVRTLMAASDILVSKAGGLTSAEAMASGLPMIMVNPIPGQEMRNADLIVEHQAGWKALNLSHFQYKLSRVLYEPELLAKARGSTSALAKPSAARKILADVLASI
jgi:processive 1,2-diacylglycerol beta-glucosyltransferase